MKYPKNKYKPGMVQTIIWLVFAYVFIMTINAFASTNFLSIQPTPNTILILSFLLLIEVGIFAPILRGKFPKLNGFDFLIVILAMIPIVVTIFAWLTIGGNITVFVAPWMGLISSLIGLGFIIEAFR